MDRFLMKLWSGAAAGVKSAESGVAMWMLLIMTNGKNFAKNVDISLPGKTREASEFLPD